MAEVPPIRTRQPTGKPPWPMIVLAGVEKSGKSWAAAEFSASDLIDRTFWCELGEGAADQYGALPGARYEILQHDGSYASIRRELWAATQQPRLNGKPNAIVVDPVSALWTMLSNEAQYLANERARRAAEKNRKAPPIGDRNIGPDLWNGAKNRWNTIIDLLRKHDGPVLLIARLELVTVMDKDGKPTTEKTWSIKAEKNLGFEADAIVRYTAPLRAELTGVRSVILRMEPGGVIPMPDFSVDGLLRQLGLDQADATAPRTYVGPAPDPAGLEAEIDGNPQEQQQRGSHARGPRAATPPKGWTPQMAEELAAEYLAAIQGAPHAQALDEIAEAIKKAVRLGKITPQDRDTLLAAYGDAKRNEQQQKGEATA